MFAIGNTTRTCNSAPTTGRTVDRKRAHVPDRGADLCAGRRRLDLRRLHPLRPGLHLADCLDYIAVDASNHASVDQTIVEASLSGPLLEHARRRPESGIRHLLQGGQVPIRRLAGRERVPPRRATGRPGVRSPRTTFRATTTTSTYTANCSCHCSKMFPACLPSRRRRCGRPGTVFYLVLPLCFLRGFLDGLTLAASTLSFPSFGINPDLRCFLCHELTC